MKNLSAIILFSLITIAGYSQKLKVADVPSVVKDAFAKKYAGLKAEWNKEGDNFEAEYEGKKMSVNMETGKNTKQEMEGSVLIAPDGSVLETEEEIALSDLPKGVEEYVKNDGKKISEVFKITDKSGTVSYEIEAGKEEYWFDTNGTFVKSQAKRKAAKLIA